MRSSRRMLVKRGLVMIAGAAGIGGGAAAVSSAGGDRTAESFALRGRAWHLASQVRRGGELPLAGDRLLGSGEFLDDAGEPVGAFHASYFGVDAPGRVGPSGLTSLQLHTLVLPEGTLVGSGTASHDPDATDEFAIVGGTGRYAGARGSYRAVQRYLELGGDGTAEFDITLIP